MPEPSNGVLSGLKIAVTVDDQWQWVGIPFPTGYDCRSVSKAMLDAFDTHQVPGVYAFNSTAATEDDPHGLDILDDWCAAGHHVGNHTHRHISLNWLDTETYLRDVEASEKILAPWIEAAPSRYFRYAFAMEGESEAKTRIVQTHLTKTGYLSNPVTLWFYDAQFAIAYQRAVELGDREAMRSVEDTLIETALAQVTQQATAVEQALGRSAAHILLVHGTAVAGATIDRILGRLAAEGVQFVTSEEAMADPANVIGPPLSTRKFRNSSQKWAEYAGLSFPDTPPAAIVEIEKTAPIEGMSFEGVLGRAIGQWQQSLPFTPVPADFH